ncbi:MAG: hypothetical protein R3Y59_03635 [bacterium]
MHNNIDYITISIVIVIIFIQLKFLIQNLFKLKLLKNIFKLNDNEKHNTVEIDKIVYINTPNDISYVLKEIIDTINKYLKENRGAASDFHLIKDIVDRNCDSVEEEVSTLTPIPLYLGLIGTMLGILIGVGYLVFNGGINSLLTGGENAGNGIVQLLGGVALAMISSICGIAFTTLGSYFTKGAKNKLNEDKNKFFSWIQVNLLPTLNDNAASIIYTLQHNLTSFNDIFSKNMVDMNDNFGIIGQTYRDQVEVLEILNNLDIKQISKANIAVLKELRKSTSEFATFNSYLNNVSTYIDNVVRLNNSINEHLNRTQAIEKMSEYFISETQQIETRKSLISSSIEEIDKIFQTSLNKLQENASHNMEGLMTESNALQNNFAKAIKEQADLMQTRLKEMSIIIEEMKELKGIRASMNGVENAIKEQSKKIDTMLTKTLSNAGVQNTTNSINNTSSKWFKATIIATCTIVCLASGFYIYKEAYKLFSEVQIKETTFINNTNKNTPPQNPIQQTSNNVKNNAPYNTQQ